MSISSTGYRHSPYPTRKPRFGMDSHTAAILAESAKAAEERAAEKAKKEAEKKAKEEEAKKKKEEKKK